MGLLLCCLSQGVSLFEGCASRVRCNEFAFVAVETSTKPLLDWHCQVKNLPPEKQGALSLLSYLCEYVP
jgi:hypothetical protein